MGLVSWLYAALLVLAVIVLAGAEWPRLAARTGIAGRKQRDRDRRKSNLRLLRTPSESDKFAASVERDLAELPTIEDPRPASER